MLGCGGGQATAPVGGGGGGTGQPPPTAGFSVLVTFTALNGANPDGSLTFDSAGNLYGTTTSGGSAYCAALGHTGCGTVYELTPGADGSWTQKILYSFSGGSDGSGPTGGVTLDTDGNLYGVANAGGGASACASGGCGTVFELSPSADGAWTESTLFTFSGVSTGVAPLGGVTLDAAGNIYGTTSFGGNSGCGCGLVYELSPSSASQWQETVLHEFLGYISSDGGYPQGRLVFDSKGNIYGTSSGAVEYTAGGDATAFELTPVSGGAWNYATIYMFSKTQGGDIVSGLSLDAQGNLYGTAESGGTKDEGVVFELTQGTGNTWNETTLYNFQGGSDGALPNAPALFDSAGNLYATTSAGGAASACDVGSLTVGCGTIFKLTPGTGGSWTETVLYTFTGESDGIGPWGLVEDSQENLYGVASLGATQNNGVAFRYGLK
jgi:hypothetical protein